MSSSSRTEKSLLNVLTGIFGQMFSFVLSFVIRTVFIKTLGEVYLGLNGLYSNILSVLSLTELGLGMAIVIELYRTVAQEDDEKTKQYLALYKKAYFTIGMIILLVGLSLTPFLQYLVNDKESLELVDYRLIFVLYLINTTFSYFFFEYRQSILQANQTEYRSRIITYAFKLLEMLLQIVGLICFKNIYVYLIIPMVLGCISTIVKGVLVAKWYPIIKEKPAGKLSSQELKVTWRNIASVATYKISGCVINSTDNIILSSQISLILTGVYSNYLVITSAVSTVMEKAFSAFTASLGNLNVSAEEDLEKKYQVFKTLSFLNFWLYGFCAVCMFVLFEPFVVVWVGDKFVLDSFTEMIIVLNFLIIGLQETVGTHRAAYGLFYKGRFRPIFTVILNVGLSFLFVNVMPQKYGVVAVLLGTIFSNLLTGWWYDSWLVHKYGFHNKPYKFYVTFWMRILYVMLLCYSLNKICGLIHISPIINILVYGIICFVLYNVLFILLFHQKMEFKYFMERVRWILRKR